MIVVFFDIPILLCDIRHSGAFGDHLPQFRARREFREVGKRFQTSSMGKRTRERNGNKAVSKNRRQKNRKVDNHNQNAEAKLRADGGLSTSPLQTTIILLFLSWTHILLGFHFPLVIMLLLLHVSDGLFCCHHDCCSWLALPQKNVKHSDVQYSSYAIILSDS